ncbi:hypothetical protein HW452_05040 [Halomonas aquamarina]|uniref:Uncharacterized protein n=1 Tax=Vreelandella aquamarina TaxID=77097 RepID=A0ACC5VRS5_9GAMM|nr:hypothetical protein [Halomonas aquamarina]MBZ5486886.1 hypothetical protein [Halomonas aquamarina]
MATATNQDQLNEVTDELVRRVQDALLAALGTINIGEQQRIGLLAAIDNLANAPIGDLQELLRRLTLADVAGRSVVGGSGRLMAESAFRLGDSVGSGTSAIDDSLRPTEFTRYPSGASSPFGRAGMGFRTRYTSAGSAQELHIDAISGDLRTRVGDGNGSSIEWQPPTKFYSDKNILGRVSQSGGIPTGAIIERGQNSDGEYVKYADGSAVCWRTVDSLTTDSYVNYNYPINLVLGSVSGSFSCRVDVLSTNRRQSLRDHSLGTGGQWSLGFKQAESYNPATVPIVLLAHGRWY